MTIKEVIKTYQKELKASKNKKNTTSKIIRKINKLNYAKNKKPISIEHKKLILINLRSEVLLESQRCFAHDNKEHLELLNKAIATLGGKK